MQACRAVSQGSTSVMIARNQADECAERVFGAASRGRAGFTLVEVVVAGAVFLLVTSAVIGAFSYARRTASLTENRLACLHIARESLESLHREVYSSAALSLGRHNRLPGQPAARGYYDVAQDDAFGRAKRITVVVNWVEPTGMSQSLSLTTVHSFALH